ncbi:MAG TPA: hypothetical protein PKC24_15170 [Cyclobacteriaceae bacterium]|nr:hypothetical protein [Cyclobacteriaceae bacterium]
MKKSFKKILKKRPVLKYSLELLVIVAGISISFAIENWREDLQEEKTYKAILEELVMDLKADSTNYQRGVDYRVDEAELLIKYLRTEDLSKQELRNWFFIVTGRRLEIKQQTGGYTHWENAPGITFRTSELSSAISGYYNDYYKKLQEAYAHEQEFYLRAQNFLVQSPTSVLASFTFENDPRFPDNFFNELFTDEVEADYRVLAANKTMQYFTEAKLFIIVNERQMYKRGLELSADLLQRLYHEIDSL